MGLARRNKMRRFTAGVRAERGFTLIEVMVTLIIMAFGMLASVVGIMAALDHSLMNEMRNDAMKIAQEQQEVVRNMAFAAIPQIPNILAKNGPIQRLVRKTLVTYTVNCNLPAPPAAAPGFGGRIVDFTVQWTFKGKTYSCELQTIVREGR